MSAGSPAPSADVSYVYAVGRADVLLDAAVDRMTGLDGGPARTVESDGLVAVVSSVPEAAYSSEGMKAQMEGLERLEVIARTHHAVVGASYDVATVLPMRLATVYLDDTRVAAMLGERHREFDELLSWLEGQVELGVKVYADPRQASEAVSPAPAAAPARNPEAALAAGSPGRAYLQERRAARRTHQDAYRAAGAVAAAVSSRATTLARARVAHRPQQGELASSSGENIANDAYLIPASDVENFRRALRGLADDVPGVRIELTGPWAPYSFATPPPSGEGGAE